MLTEIPVIDDTSGHADKEVKALIAVDDISFVCPIQHHTDRCRLKFKGHGFVVVALSYDSLKALLIERRVKDLMMAPEPS